MSESTHADSPAGGGATWGARLDAITACFFKTEDQLAAAAGQLRAQALASDILRVGAADRARAQQVAVELGLRGDVDPADPLKGLGNLSTESATRKSVDRGSLVGAAAGAIVGLGLSFTPLATLIPVEPSARLLGLAIFAFVVGSVVGSVLGAAFAPQSSTHAGFRLIDGMQDGGLTLLIASTPADSNAVSKVLESCGGAGITRL